MFESVLISNNINFYNSVSSYPSFLVCLYLFLFCFSCVCLFARTYVFFLICIEMSLVLLCFLVLLVLPGSFGLCLSFLYILLAAGETALLLVVLFNLREAALFVPFANLTHTSSI